MKLNKNIVLIAIGLFLGAVVLVLAVSRSATLFAPAPATLLPLSSCDLQRGPCSAALPGGGRITLTFEPRPVKPMTEFRFRLVAEGVSEKAIKKAALSFTGVGMNMGLNRFALKRDNGAFVGKGILPVCVRNRMDWEVQARITTEKGVFAAPFRFTTFRR